MIAFIVIAFQFDDERYYQISFNVHFRLFSFLFFLFLMKTRVTCIFSTWRCLFTLKPTSTWWGARSDHTIYCYVNEKLRKITDLVEQILEVEMVSTPKRTKSVCWSLRQSDFGKSKIVNKLRNGSHICLHLRSRARCGVWKNSSLRYFLFSHNNGSLARLYIYIYFYKIFFYKTSINTSNLLIRQ